MTTFSKRILSFAILVSIAYASFADRGVAKKSKAKTTLNISTSSTLKNSILFNLKTGLSYKGSLLSTNRVAGSPLMNTTLVTYQKGNTTYIIPYKHKIAVPMPEMRQGYTGVKIIIRTHK